MLTAAFSYKPGPGLRFANLHMLPGLLGNLFEQAGLIYVAPDDLCLDIKFFPTLFIVSIFS